MDTPDTVRPESTPPAQPDFAAIWGHTGLLYTLLTAVSGPAGYVLSYLFWDPSAQPDRPGTLDQVFLGLQWSSFHALALGALQWFILRRFVLRALRALAGRRDLSLPEKQLVRDTAWWIIATFAAIALGGVLMMFIDGFLYTILQGYLLGKAQWFVIRRHVPEAKRWTRWTVGAHVLFSIAIAIVPVVYLVGTFMASIVVYMVGMHFIGGLCLGGLQAICMRKLAPGWIDKMRDRVKHAPVDGA